MSGAVNLVDFQPTEEDLKRYLGMWGDLDVVEWTRRVKNDIRRRIRAGEFGDRVTTLNQGMQQYDDYMENVYQPRPRRAAPLQGPGNGQYDGPPSSRNYGNMAPPQPSGQALTRGSPDSFLDEMQAFRGGASDDEFLAMVRQESARRERDTPGFEDEVFRLLTQ